MTQRAAVFFSCLALALTACGEDGSRSAVAMADAEPGVEDVGQDASDPTDAAETADASPDVALPPEDATEDAGEDVPLDAGEDASQDGGDAAADVEETGDTEVDAAEPDGGLEQPFPDILREGVWLIGWHGGLEHFSWVRFDFVDMTRGSIEVRDPRVEINMPFFACEGTGLFTAETLQRELVLQAPQCEGEVASGRYSWGAQSQTPPEFMTSAILAVNISDLDNDGPGSTAYLFPLDFCEEDFSACRDPFQ